MQWNIVNSYAAIYDRMGAWANITFGTYEDTLQAYELLKNTQPKFRDSLVYGSLRNVKDLRTVVISVIRKDVTEKTIQQFLKSLSEKSVARPQIEGEQQLPANRKYDFFSFNILEEKTFFIDNEGIQVGAFVD
jgi:hypothetical protein